MATYGAVSDAPGAGNTANDSSKDFTNISLEAEASEKNRKPGKKPRRILHFSDGILEEYSTDEEEEQKKQAKKEVVDPKTLAWLPWLWYYMITAASRTLSVADTCGEKLAWFLGITSPKYQYAIDEYYRLKEEEEAEMKRQSIRPEDRLTGVDVEQDSTTPPTTEKPAEPEVPVEKY